MICPNWQYLRTLDTDLENAARYVDIRQENYGTFSIEFVRLILAAGSEIDVVAKLLCGKIEPSKSSENINDYRDIIIGKYPKFHTMIIDVPQYEMQLVPWETWGSNATPDWWKAHNQVKHHRDTHFKDANLQNTINAVAGLFIMIWYLHHEDTARKKLNKTTLLSAERYIGGMQWANTYYCQIPEDNP